MRVFSLILKWAIKQFYLLKSHKKGNNTKTNHCRMRNLIFRLLLLCTAVTATAQNQPPVIRANVKMISIRDGKDTRVTFITDLDSISFDTHFGKTFDFVVLLNGKDSCFTRISANYEGLNNPKSNSMLPDSIPFHMKNSRIYFDGKLNGHPGMNIMFDLGAATSCISIDAVQKAGIKFDGKSMVKNGDGLNEEPTSSHNHLQIGRLDWDKVQLVQVRNLAKGEDMIIGNSLFQDQVLEIDYDKKIMIVHKELNKDLKEYSKHDVIYDQHRPLFNIEINVAGKFYPFHFLFDTGRDGTMLIGDDFVKTYNLWDKFKSVFKIGTKKAVVIPQVKIGGLTFDEVMTNANDPAHPNGKQSLIGNELLNQFNVILDNHNGLIYLKPNSLKGGKYATYSEFKIQAALVIGGILLFIAILIWLFRKWRKRKQI
eukprot:gene12207-14926_t